MNNYTIYRCLGILGPIVGSGRGALCRRELSSPVQEHWLCISPEIRIHEWSMVSISRDCVYIFVCMYVCMYADFQCLR